ncbi:MAG: hypothetical protein IJP70_10955 [Bacteroidales bacterium]|nr:hypothetical protein [Bacteroidales bacterium]
MIINKKEVSCLVAFCLAILCTAGFAQNLNPSNLTSSPYTRYGFGKLGTVGNTSTRAMGDAGIALRSNLYTNLYNPASLTAIDTLTLLFDTGLDAEWFSVSENGSHEYDWNAGFSYMTFHFPLWNRFAGSIAYTPYSMVGYEYGNESKEAIGNALTSNDTLVYSNSYSGNGGLQHFQLSLAWEPLKARTQTLNLGASIGYICGTVEHAGSMYVSSGQSNSTYSGRNFTVKGFDVLLGAQYTHLLGPSRNLVFGATFAPRTPLSVHSDVTKVSGSDTVSTSSKITLYAPLKFGAGVSYQYDRRLTLTGEYSFENWSKVAGFDANLNKADDVYQNISKVAFGAEYRPKTYAQNYFQTCLYRMGASIKSSYIETYGSQNTEYSVSCGIGMPTLNKRSVFNFSVAYTHLQPSKSHMLSENYLHFTVGITFNEMMFYRSRLF